VQKRNHDKAFGGGKRFRSIRAGGLGFVNPSARAIPRPPGSYRINFSHTQSDLGYFAAKSRVG
ncbi:hypothetical protein, partial [Candidatus Thiosymbion oneisti]|uniref:hypothetical protein n=1 Tax=Candidatus Thiosymbion oneisti TaxID=589554 RepID=UPI001AAC81EB